MANMQRRQKQLEKKAAKRKAVHAKLRQATSPDAKLVRAIDAPIEEAFLAAADPRNPDSGGMCQAYVARQISNGELAVAIFLIDWYCIGVKDSFVRFQSPPEYRRMLQKIHSMGQQRFPVDSNWLQNFVVRSALYGRQNGFAPRGDFAKAMKILGEPDFHIEDLGFEFGKDGKPFYIASQNESSAATRAAMKALIANRGEGNFNYIMAVTDPVEIDELEVALENKQNSVNEIGNDLELAEDVVD